MVLSELFKPNKFDTVPTLIISGLGCITPYNDKTAVVKMDNHQDEYISMDTEVLVVNTSETRACIKTPSIADKYVEIQYLKPFTAEERMIHEAMGIPFNGCWVRYNGTTYRKATWTNPPKILHNGTGWVFEEPVEFFVEDILYRLDLQGELK